MFVMEEHRPTRVPVDTNGSAVSVGIIGIQCPQCPVVSVDETSLAAHLLSCHNMRLVVTSSTNFLGSEASSQSSSPTASDPSPASKTSCPVCRQQVVDLPQHFALAHCSQTGSSSAPDSVASTAVASSAARATILGANSVPQHQTTLQQKLQQLKRRHSKGSRVTHVKVKVEDEDQDQENGAINLSVRDSHQPERNNNNDNVGGSFNCDDGTDAAVSSKEQQRKARRKQTSVPEREKDQRYWTRRLKNNEAAKRSRDMRIQREKIIFDENARLEEKSTALLLEKDRLTTENKELRLKMEFILEENANLKAIIESLQRQPSVDSKSGILP